jgi:GNAT superfamily N-acetyltransferase
MGEPEARNSADDRFRLEALSACRVADDVLTQLEALYAGAYHNSHMHERLVADLSDPPEVFRLFAVRDRARVDQIVGARVIQWSRHDFVDYRGFAPIHGKRFTVHPAHRGRGLGRRLLRVTNDYVFNELGEPVVFGESNEIGALSMHTLRGALVHLGSVADHFPRNTQAQALSLFAEFLTNPRLRSLRLPTGYGVQFVHCHDYRVAAKFLGDGYTTRDDLLAARGADSLSAEAQTRAELDEA